MTIHLFVCWLVGVSHWLLWWDVGVVVRAFTNTAILLSEDRWGWKLDGRKKIFHVGQWADGCHQSGNFISFDSLTCLSASYCLATWASRNSNQSNTTITSGQRPSDTTRSTQAKTQRFNSDDFKHDWSHWWCIRGSGGYQAVYWYVPSTSIGWISVYRNMTHEL